MKNAHIKPGQLVPAELRLEIYKEAKRSIEAGDTFVKYRLMSSLWHLFEKILYEECNQALNTLIHSRIMFPEFKEDVIYVLDNTQALSELTKAIEELEKKTVKPTATTKGQQSIIDNISNSINKNLNELSFDAALNVYNQIRERIRERLADEMNAHEERINYLKSIEL